MDRIQRSGLISLVLLLGVGAAGILMGPGKVNSSAVQPEEVVLQPGALPAIDLLAPEQRKLFVGAERFTAEPITHPLTNEGARSIQDAPDWKPAEPTPAVAVAQPLDVQRPVIRTSSTVRVREKETLSEIAQRELGTKDEWRALANFNNIGDPSKIRIGQEINIPVMEDLIQARAASASNASNAASTTSNSTTQKPNLGPTEWGTYTVQSGDVAGNISMKVYGTSKLWPLILDANGIADPKELRAGQVLRIPPKPE